MPEDCVFHGWAPDIGLFTPLDFCSPLRAGFLFVLVVEDRRFDVINHIVRNIEVPSQTAQNSVLLSR